MSQTDSASSSSRSHSRLRLTLLSCLAVIVFSLGALAYQVLSEKLPQLGELRAKGLTILPQPRTMQPFQLWNQDGAAFTPDSLRGGWSLLFFGFTHCPDICPTTLSIMAQARDLMPEGDLLNNLALYLVSVDPDRDDQDRLREYITSFGERFRAVGGEREPLAGFAGQVGVAFAKMPLGSSADHMGHAMGSPADQDGVSYTIDHSAQVVVFDPRGNYHAFLKPPQDPRVMAQSLQVLAAAFRR